MGRFLDATGTPDNPLQGLSLDGELSPSLAPARVPVAAVSKVDEYTFWTHGVGSPIEDSWLRAFGDLGRLPTADPAKLQARTVATEVDGLRRNLAQFVPKNGTPAYTSPVTYPSNDLGARLGGLAAILAAGLPVRCVTLNGEGGYDTHSNQKASLPADLKATCDAVLAFQRDLEARGLQDRVLVKLWSEFGRRPQENGSGTDHGAAGAAFLIGSRASGRMVGEFSGLATLDPDDNLRATSDFRALYCGLIEQWFGTDAAPIIPGASGFARPTLLKA